jgi:[ribosomal protein S5]-alanine N-acetyltransferase
MAERAASPPDRILETERLLIRRLREPDVDALHAVLGDAETMRYYPAPFDRDGCAAWIEDSIERYARDGFGLYGLELRATGELIGDCGPAVRAIEGVDEVEMGWHVRRDLWGRGLAPEAARACLAHAFGPLGLRRMTALVRPVNRPSARVAEKIGMTVERRVTHGGLPHLLYVVERDAGP